MSLDELVQSLLKQIKDMIQTETVIGKPIKVDDTTLIPVSKISVGFGAMGGKLSEGKKKDGEGTGGGVSVEPIAFIVIQENRVELISLRESKSDLSKIIDLVPQIAQKFKSPTENKKSKPSNQKKGSS
ncbi:sporulation protein [candidate division KSB1 bacterium]|nr:sporulation protein [candidate division KSB1 bacterium]